MGLEQPHSPAYVGDHVRFDGLEAPQAVPDLR
jgi:hypothetical protein